MTVDSSFAIVSSAASTFAATRHVKPRSRSSQRRTSRDPPCSSMIMTRCIAIAPDQQPRSRGVTSPTIAATSAASTVPCWTSNIAITQSHTASASLGNNVLVRHDSSAHSSVSVNMASVSATSTQSCSRLTNEHSGRRAAMKTRVQEVPGALALQRTDFTRTSIARNRENDVSITGGMNENRLGLFAVENPWASTADTPPTPERGSSLRLVRPEPREPETDRLAPAAVPALPFTWKAIEHETAIIELIDSKFPGEIASEVFRRKEHALGAIFASLSITDAWQLHRRLTVSSPLDPIATRFGRLVADRRARLINFLGDARRRSALAAPRSR